MMRIEIPLKCPDCNGRMYSVSYDVSLKVLKCRSWQYCRDCGFMRETDDFKRELLSV